MIKLYRILFKISCLILLLSVAIPINLVHALDNPAGRILRMEGAVIIVRDSRTMNGSTDLKIYADDVIKTGPGSLVELLLQDGSSLHMGPDSQLELNEFRFSLGKDKPSFIARMAKGLFVYISGAISKVHPGSVKFETPDATIGIRGTKLVLKIDDLKFEKDMETEALPGCKETTVVLFRDPTGNVGKVTVSNIKGGDELNKEFYAIHVKCDSAPSKPMFLDRASLEKMIPESLHSIVFENYRPPLPYTESENPLINPDNPVTPPKPPKTFSESAPPAS